jgi:hypothetical protein
LDFCVTKGIPRNFAEAKSSLEPSSEHSPVLVTLSTQSILRVPQPRHCNRKTDKDVFRHLLNEKLLLNVPLKTDSDIEATNKNFNDIIQWAGLTTTPEHTEARQTYDCPILIKQKLLNKRRLHRNRHRFCTPESKRLLNVATRELTQFLADTNNASFQTFFQDLSPTTSTDYSLWKAIKKAKQATNSSHPLRTTRGTWARTNTEKSADIRRPPNIRFSATSL